MANTEWWQRGPIDGVPAVLQPIAHILLQVRESVGEIVEPLTEQEWNDRPAGVASAAFHVRHIAGVIDRLFTYARGTRYRQNNWRRFSRKVRNFSQRTSGPFWARCPHALTQPLRSFARSM
jgi:hypothetical protein